MAKTYNLTAAKIWYFIMCCASAAVYPFFTVYFQLCGFSKSQTGILIAVRPALTAIMGNAWAGLADHYHIHRPIFLACYVIGVFFQFSTCLTSFFPAALAIRVFTEIFGSPVMVLADAASMAASSEVEGGYGRVRMWGAIGWGAMSPIGGWIISARGFRFEFYVFLILNTLGLIPAVFVPIQVLTHRSRAAHVARQTASHQHQQSQEAWSPPLASRPRHPLAPGSESSDPSATPALLDSHEPSTALPKPPAGNQADQALPGSVAESGPAAAADATQLSQPTDRPWPESLPAQPPDLARLESAGSGSSQGASDARPDAGTNANAHHSHNAARLLQGGSSWCAHEAKEESSQLRGSRTGAPADSPAAAQAERPGPVQADGRVGCTPLCGGASYEAGVGCSADHTLASVWAALERLPLSSHPAVQAWHPAALQSCGAAQHAWRLSDGADTSHGDPQSPLLPIAESATLDSQGGDGRQRGLSAFQRVRVVVGRREVATFLLMAVMFGYGMGTIDSFLFIYLRELGGSEFLMGLCLATMCATEAPLFHFANRIFDFVGLPQTLHMVMGVYIFRLCAYGCLGLAGTPWAVLPIEVLHGITFGCAWAAGTLNCSRVAPRGLEATTQAIFNGLYMGVGLGMGGVVGGVIYDHAGAQALFFSAAAVLSFGWLAIFIAHQLSKCSQQLSSKPIKKNGLQEHLLTS